MFHTVLCSLDQLIGFVVANGQFHRKGYQRVKKLTYKVCFPLKINEEGLLFDDEVKKVGNNITSRPIYF